MKRSVLTGALALLLAFGFAACSDGDDNKKQPEPGTPDPEFTTLVVTGIPAGANILAAALMDELNPSSVPVATGLYVDGAALYEPSNFMPDPEKPWKETGSYIIFLISPKDGATLQEIASGDPSKINVYAYTGIDVSGVDFANPATLMTPEIMGLAGGMAAGVFPEYDFAGELTVELPWNYFIDLFALQAALSAFQQQGS